MFCNEHLKPSVKIKTNLNVNHMITYIYTYVFVCITDSIRCCFPAQTLALAISKYYFMFLLSVKIFNGIDKARQVHLQTSRVTALAIGCLVR